MQGLICQSVRFFICSGDGIPFKCVQMALFPSVNLGVTLSPGALHHNPKISFLVGHQQLSSCKCICEVGTFCPKCASHPIIDIEQHLLLGCSSTQSGRSFGSSSQLALVLATLNSLKSWETCSSHSLPWMQMVSRDSESHPFTWRKEASIIYFTFCIYFHLFIYFSISDSLCMYIHMAGENIAHRSRWNYTHRTKHILYNARDPNHEERAPM